MNWSVLWVTGAEFSLADMWVNGDDKLAITQAANRIDALLRKDPLNTGESREGYDRVHFDSPLGVLFNADPNDRIVNVLRVWRIS